MRQHIKADPAADSHAMGRPAEHFSPRHDQALHSHIGMSSTGRKPMVSFGSPPFLPLLPCCAATLQWRSVIVS